MNSKEITFLLAVVISCLGNSQTLPLSLDREPSIVETDLLWNGKRYCLRFLTMDATGTENELKKAIEYGLKIFDEPKETRTNSNIPKNIINDYDQRSTGLAVVSNTEMINEQPLLKGVKFDGDAFSNPALENKLKTDIGKNSSKNKENRIEEDIINIIFMTPKSKTRAEENGYEIVFPTEEHLATYDEVTEIPTGLNIFDRAELPPALVASLLG